MIPRPTQSHSYRIKPDVKADAKPDAKADPKTGAKPDAKPASQDDLKTLPWRRWRKLGRRRTASPRLRRRNGSHNTGRMNLPKRRRISSEIPQLFLGPIPWMIEVAVILSGVVRHWPDFFIILLLLVTMRCRLLGGTPGGNEIAALKAKLAIKPRDSRWQMDQSSGS